MENKPVFGSKSEWLLHAVICVCVIALWSVVFAAIGSQIVEKRAVTVDNSSLQVDVGHIAEEETESVVDCIIRTSPLDSIDVIYIPEGEDIKAFGKEFGFGEPIYNAEGKYIGKAYRNIK